MPTITKRTGHKQPFDSSKIQRALTASSDEAGQPMGQSDIALILDDVQSMLKGKKEATSFQIYMMVAGSLYVRGFKGVLRAYEAYTKNAWTGK